MKVKEAIIVEGVYDKIKLDSILDATVVTTDGFKIFKDKEKTEYIKMLAQKTGIAVLTDSDRAGFLIRNHIKNTVGTQNVKHAFIPDIKGKEKRKNAPSKEGLLGVEGVDRDIIVSALLNAGCTVDGENIDVPEKLVTVNDLYSDGFSGGEDSRAKRVQLAEKLGLPKRISTRALLCAINTLCGYEMYQKIKDEIKEGE